MRILQIILIVSLVSGCVSAYTGVGSRAWHDARLTELREALTAGDISMEKYLELKNEADKIRLEYTTERSRDLYISQGFYRPHFGIGVGYHPYCAGHCR